MKSEEQRWMILYIHSSRIQRVVHHQGISHELPHVCITRALKTLDNRCSARTLEGDGGVWQNEAAAWLDQNRKAGWWTVGLQGISSNIGLNKSQTNKLENLASTQEVFRPLTFFGGGSSSSVDFWALGLRLFFLPSAVFLGFSFLGFFSLLPGSSWLGWAEARAVRKMVLGGMKVYIVLSGFLGADNFECKGQDFLSLISSIRAREDLC